MTPEEIQKKEEELKAREEKINATQNALAAKVDIYNTLADRGISDASQLKTALTPQNQSQEIVNPVTANTQPESEVGNTDEEEWRNKAERFMLHLSDMLGVEKLHRQIAMEIKNNPVGLEYLEKGMTDQVAQNLHYKMTQKGAKPLRAELEELNKGFIDFKNRFDGIKPPEAKSIDLKPTAGKTPEAPETPASPTLPSHGTASNTNSKPIQFKPPERGEFDVKAATAQFDKANPPSSFMKSEGQEQ